MYNIENLLSLSFQTLSSHKSRMVFASGMSTFCILFLYLFQPFNISQWIHYTTPFKLFTLSGVSFISVFIIFSSQLFQAYLWDGKVLKIYHLFIGFLFDVLSLSVPLSILYAAPENQYWIELIQTLGMVIPSVALWYILGLSMMELINSRNQLLQKNEIEKPILTSMVQPHLMVKITDDSGQLRLSLNKEDLLYVESADNYVIVYYKKGGRVSKEMIRNTLKNLEQSLKQAGCIRCHRSYIVGISSLLCFRKSGRSYIIEVKWTDKVIPVSRGYVSVIKDLFV